MIPDPVVLVATVVLLLPMGYFLLASPAFLLVKLDIPPVSLLLRSMFDGYFIVLAVAGLAGSAAFAAKGRLSVSFIMGLIAVVAIFARRWFLRQMDAELRARDAGDPDVARRLRRLHWAGMLSNATLCIAIVASFPSLLTPT